MTKIKNFFGKLVSACPFLPYMAMGIALAWSFIAYSGTAWLSDTEIDGANISILFIMSSNATGIAMLAATLMVPRVKRMLERPAWIISSGAISSVGCLVVILVGPYYLYPLFLTENMVMLSFMFGGVLSGIGISIVYLKCAEMYSKLPPRRVILYVSLSHIVVAAIYFVVIGLPDWAPVSGGPSFAGIVSFVGMPMLAGLLASTSLAVPHEDWCDERKSEPCVEQKRGLTKPFWKLIVVVMVFTIVMTAVRAAVVEISPVDVTFDNTRLVMLLRMVIAIIFACATIVIEGELFNFGRIYSAIMAAGVAIVAFLPIVGVLHLVWNQIISVVAILFEFVLWCILSFIVYQKRISPILVFGLAYGGYQLGGCFGWAMGAYGFKWLMGASSHIALYMVLAAVVLVCAFVLFSEKEFDNLFKPTSEDEASLEDLLREDLKGESDQENHLDRKGKFSQAIEELAAECHLSHRETDVFRCLAMGYDSSAISKKLQISWNTVRSHTRNVYGKLSVHSKQELLGLVDEKKNMI